MIKSAPLNIIGKFIGHLETTSGGRRLKTLFRKRSEKTASTNPVQEKTKQNEN